MLQEGLYFDEIVSIYLMIFFKFYEILIYGGKCKGFFTTYEYKEVILLDIHGQFPVSASNKTMPNDQTSALRLYSSFLSIYGAI